MPSETQKSSSISEEDLDKLVDNAVCKQPLCGIVMIQAEIRRQGILDTKKQNTRFLDKTRSSSQINTS